MIPHTHPFSWHRGTLNLFFDEDIYGKRSMPRHEEAFSANRDCYWAVSHTAPMQTKVIVSLGVGSVSQIRILTLELARNVIDEVPLPVDDDTQHELNRICLHLKV
jgi:hypothetical protein